MVGLHLLWVEIDVDFSFRSTYDAYRSDSVDTRQWVAHVVVENLIQCLLRLFCLY